ncbi:MULTISPECIES: cell envelope integrity protein TolA [unclassified Ectothiorhodospira]|uniref:cell envelope integrity protein TolA n=1 Tax=unclassified Ectothiorhodospira TaxID=2684909 RepID=UPI001EE80952|nr:MULTISPECIES: cell envelope integrity protein TolA [unclassified Ectothiorhodospira]MCG5515912.1 cell envelope integrity protein TolA [Ectothiorhodospira sp. 9100]MCG5518748.1 cell envelope integrity protein TolA [Ectothiorhodospira sp. 9905]
MWSLLTGHRRLFVWVLSIHVLLFLVLGVNLHFKASADPTARGKQAQVEVVEAVAMDGETFDRARQAREEAREEALRQAREQIEAERRREEEARRQEAERRAQAEQARREAEQRAQAERERAEAERQAREQRQREEAERQAREQREREEAERRAQAQREREEAERRAEEARRQAEEARLRERMEAEQRRLEQAEAERQRAARQRELDRQQSEYAAAIRSAVQRHWRRPDGHRSGQSAVVFVRQSPGGFIQQVRVEQCTGNAMFCESVERAVRLAEPLPSPPDPDLFAREIRFTFEPS